MEEIIKNILSEAVYAPSGDNIQPWRFELKQNELFVYNIPEKDSTLYNYKQHGSFIAHGALLENISLIAPVYGYTAAISSFPDNIPNATAKVRLEAADKSVPDLYASIAKRYTNRKSYKNIPLTAEQKQKLLNLNSSTSEIKIVLVAETEKIKPLAHAISQGDRLIFENKTIHDFLFSHIRWTEAEEQQYKTGLFLKTMELSKGQEGAFRLFKNWAIMNVFNTLGMPKMAVKGNEKLYSQGSALGGIIISSPSDENYLLAGRLFQRLWLTLTALGLSLQPLTAVPLLNQKIFDSSTGEFSKSDISILKESYGTASKILGANDKTLALMFRLGFAEPPSGTSSRLAPEIKIIS